MMPILKQQTPSKQTTVKIPGKLYLVGEYAILAANQPAILLAVDRYLTVSIQRCTDGEGWVESAGRYYHYQRLADKNNRIAPLSEADYANWRYVHSAIQTVEKLALELGMSLIDFQAHIKSDLDNTEGIKLGLGSSGAVTVGIIRALLKIYGITVASPMMIYKLAVLAQLSMGATGSFGDIASNCYGGIVYYRSPDRDELAHSMNDQTSIRDLLSAPWPHLQIESITIPEQLAFHFCWTGSPASTDRLVGHLTQQLVGDPTIFDQFCDQAYDVVETLRKSLINDDNRASLQAIRQYDILLRLLATHYQLNIITPSLDQCIRIAQRYGCAAKSSGAGGGDCAIAVSKQSMSTDAINQMRKEWTEQGLVPLSLHMTPLIEQGDL